MLEIQQCDECGKGLIESDTFHSTVYLPRFDFTVTGLLFCRDCFEKLKGVN